MEIFRALVLCAYTVSSTGGEGGPLGVRSPPILTFSPWRPMIGTDIATRFQTEQNQS